MPRGRLDSPPLLFFAAAPQFVLLRGASRFFSGTGRALFLCLDLPAFGFLFLEDSLAFFFGASRLFLLVLPDALLRRPARQLLLGAETLLANPLPLFLFLAPQGLFFEALTLGFGALPFGCLRREPLKLCFFRRVLLVLLRLHGEWHVHDDRHGLWGRGLGRRGMWTGDHFSATRTVRTRRSREAGGEESRRFGCSGAGRVRRSVGAPIRREYPQPAVGRRRVFRLVLAGARNEVADLSREQIGVAPRYDSRRRLFLPQESE